MGNILPFFISSHEPKFRIEIYQLRVRILKLKIVISYPDPDPVSNLDPLQTTDDD